MEGYYIEYSAMTWKNSKTAKHTGNVFVVNEMLPLSEIFYEQERYEAIRINKNHILNTICEKPFLTEYCRKITKEEAIRINPTVSTLESNAIKQ